MRFLRNRALIVTIAAVVLSMVLINWTGAGSALARSLGSAGSVVVPLQQALYQASETVLGAESGPAADTGGSVAMDYEELAAENERLRELLAYKQTNVNKELKVAQIIGKEPGNWFEVFTINVGAGDGVAVGMPVVTPDGLVGRVEEVGLGWAKVMSIIDVRSSVSAIMERTRDTGVVKGTIGSDDLSATLTMNYLPLDTDIIEGDTVLTSGYDEVYPKGLIIGSVTSSQDQSGGKLVSVDPSVDFRRLEEVMVLISTREEPEAEVTDAPLPSAEPEPSEETSGGEGAVPETP